VNLCQSLKSLEPNGNVFKTGLKFVADIDKNVTDTVGEGECSDLFIYLVVLRR